MATGATEPLPGIAAAEVVVPCAPALLDATLAFLQALGFRVDAVSPADAPTLVAVSAYGVRLLLTASDGPCGVALRLLAADPASVAGGALALTAPNGLAISVVAADAPMRMPALDAAPTHVVASRGPAGRPSGGDGGATAAGWRPGRAGLLYRDLLPGRLGGRFIASHIRVASGGPVADYVHYHKVALQLIVVVRGWVTVVYEGAGPPFTMAAGDLVLQPPRIRHRVLEASDGLEVLEVACPASHETIADPGHPLPDGHARDAARVYAGGQRFLHTRADSGGGGGAGAVWARVGGGLLARDLGVAAASAGAGSARALRAEGGGGDAGAPTPPLTLVAGAALFLFVSRGSVRVAITVATPSGAAGLGGAPDAPPPSRLDEGDACALPPGARVELSHASLDLELLEVEARC